MSNGLLYRCYHCRDALAFAPHDVRRMGRSIPVCDACLAQAETDRVYADLNVVEKRIVDGWIAGGQAKAQAVKEFLATTEDIDGDMGL